MRFFIAPAPSPASLEAALDEFAELLARETPFPEIAGKMHVSRATPCVLLHMLCEKYGEAVRL